MTQRRRLGPFVLGDRLGEGGMAQVYAARHEATGARLALKIIDPEASANLGSRAHFEREVQAVAGLTHPGIVRVFDSGVVREEEASSRDRIAPEAPWLAMELLEGGTLAEQAGRAPYRQVVRWLSELLDALAHAHARDVLHRDVKPTNLLLDGGGRLRLTDFGIAHVGGSAGLTSRRQSGAGTPLYMAPEVFDASAALGPWTDLYAVGCVAYELLTGAPPFSSTNVFALIRAHVVDPPPPLPAAVQAPAGFQEWLHRLLRKAPKDRFQRASDARRALAFPTGSDPRPLAVPPRRPPDPKVTEASGLGLVGMRPIPLTGRVAERDGLWASFREAAGGAARGAVLTGPAGVGRSRIAGWLSAAAYEQGALVAWASGGSARPIADLLGRVLRQRGPSMEMEACLAALVDEPDLAWLAAAVQALVTGDGPLKIEEDAERFGVALRLLRGLARGRPLVLVLEDVVGSERLMGFAHAGMETAVQDGWPVFVVCTARDGDGPERRADLNRLRARPDVVTLPMVPLSPRDHLTLIKNTLGLEPTLAASLSHRTQGRPWFAAEIVADWVRRGALEAGPGGYRLRWAVPLPDDLHDHWSQRVERALAGLPARDGVALELLALGDVLPDDPLWMGALQAAGVEPSHELVARLLRQRLLRDGRGLSHPLLVESLERRCREGGRWSDLHAAWCRAHEASRSPASWRALRWGRHLMESGRPAEAAALLGRAATDVAEAADHTSVPQLLSMTRAALLQADVPQDDPRWAELALVGVGPGHYEDVEAARALVDEALALCAGKLDRAHPPASFPEPWTDDAMRFWALQGQALRCLAGCIRAGGEHPRVLALLDEAEELAVASHDREGLMLVHASRGHTLHFAGDPAAAVSAFEAQRDLAMQLGQLRGRILAEECLAECLAKLGRYEEARAMLTSCAREARSAGYQRTLATVLLVLGSLEGGSDRERTWARDALNECLLIFRRFGARAKQGVALNALGDLERQVGDPATAAARYREAARVVQGTGSAWAWLAPFNLSFLLGVQGRWAEARDTMQSVREEMESHGWGFYVALGETLTLVAHAGLGDWEAFEACLAGIRDAIRTPQRYERDAAWAFLRAGQLAMEAGRPEAASLLRSAEAHAAGLDDRDRLSEARRLLAELGQA